MELETHQLCVEGLRLTINSTEESLYKITRLDGVVTLGCKLPKDPMDFDPLCYSAAFTGQFYQDSNEVKLTLDKYLSYFGNLMSGSFDIATMNLHLSTGNVNMKSFQFNFSPSSEFTRVIAHRGDSDHFPENTLIAFQKALEVGANIIELDIHLSKDGVPVVIHDNELSRTTNGSGLVQDETLAGLKKLSAGYIEKFGNKFNDQKIPTLREIFENIPSDQLLFVEIKREAVREKFEESAEFKALDLAREFNRLSSTIFISFEEKVLERLKIVKMSTGEKIRTGFIASPRTLPNEDPILKAKNLGAEWGIFSKHYRSGDLYAKPRLEPNPNFGKNKMGLNIAFWTFGEPDVEEVLNFLSNGADALASNSPRETLLLLKKYK